jgi:type II secretory pathway component PulF
MQYLALFLQQTQPDPEALKGIIMAMAIIFPIIYLVIVIIVMIPFWFILKKAGYTPWLSLLCLMPSLGALVLLYVLAFSEWKVPSTLQAAYPPQPPYPPLPPQV